MIFLPFFLIFLSVKQHARFCLGVSLRTLIYFTSSRQFGRNALNTELTAPKSKDRLPRLKFVLFWVKVSVLTRRPNSHDFPSVTMLRTRGKRDLSFIFWAATNSAKHCPQPCSKSFFLASTKIIKGVPDNRLDPIQTS